MNTNRMLATINRVEREIAKAEADVAQNDGRRWFQAETIYGSLKANGGAMTQQEVAAGWLNLKTGKPYSQQHVNFVAQVWGRFGANYYPGSNLSFEDAYRRVKVTRNPAKPRKPRTPKAQPKPPQPSPPPTSPKPTSQPKSPPKQQQAPPQPSPPPPLTVITGKPALSHNARVVDWVYDRYAEGWTRAQIVTASQQNTHGWPVPSESLTNGGVSEVRAAIVERERARGLHASAPQAQAPPPPTAAPPRQKPAHDGFADLRREDRRDYAEAVAARKTANHDKFLAVRYQITKMSNLISNIDPEMELDMDDAGAARSVVKVYEALLRQSVWLDRFMPFFERHLTDLDIRRLIRAMDENRSGRTAHENTIIDAKVARLRKKLTHRLEMTDESPDNSRPPVTPMEDTA